VGTIIGLGVLVVVLAITAYMPRRVPAPGPAHRAEVSGELSKAKTELARLKAQYGSADARAQAQQRKVAEMEEKERGALPSVAIDEPWLEPVYADPVISADVLRARLKHAETELDRITKLRADNLVSEEFMNHAKFTVELLKAELSGDPTQVAKVKLNQAELELDRVSKLQAEKLVSEEVMNQAKFNVELRRAEVAGDRAKAARVQLARAEDAFQHASKLREQKLISESDYNQRKGELELWRAYAEGLSNAPAKPKGP